MSAKDFAPIILLALTLIFFLAAAASPFATSKPDTKLAFFYTCVQVFDDNKCETIKPDSDFGCTASKDLYLAGQAMAVLTLLMCVFAMVPAIARACGKPIGFCNRSLHLVLYALMIIFGLVFMSAAFAMYFAPVCGKDNGSVKEAGFAYGPCSALATVGEILAIASTVVSKKYFTSGGDVGGYDAF